MKSKYMEQLERLKARLAVQEQDQDVPDLPDAGIDNLLKLDYIWQDGEIIRSTVPFAGKALATHFDYLL